MKLYNENNLTAVTEFFLLGFQISQLSSTILFCFLLLAYCGTICGNLLIITLASTSKILHTPMYFFISQLSINDIVLTTNLVPNTLHILLNNGGTVTFAYCITQFCFFTTCGTFECLLLTLMSYDRYLAICNPLRYSSVMTNTHCVKLVVICWWFGFLVTLINTSTVLMLTFCGPNIIDHFFCELPPLLEIACSSTFTIDLEVRIMSFPVLFIPIVIIIVSYGNIIVTILRFRSGISRQKAFSTCSAHLIVVSISYFTPLSVYFFPTGDKTSKKLLSLLYNVLTPLVNPIIYSLRNKDISKSLRETFNKYVTGVNLSIE